jgi:hypothetical protein
MDFLVSNLNESYRERDRQTFIFLHSVFFSWRSGDALKKHVKSNKSLWKMGCFAAVSLAWLIIRTGRKPSRITYPCQRAAVANVNVFLLALFAPMLDFGRLKTTLPHALDRRLTTTVLLVGSMLLAFGSVPFAGNYVPIQSDFAPVLLDLQTHYAVSSINSSELFFVENASGAGGNMDSAVSSLLQLMADHGLPFFKTADQPSGLIGKDDVIIIKVNSQWSQRGGTDTDLVKSIINKIVTHPEGFTGEIVISDNGQWMARTDQGQWWAENNAYNHSQSMLSVAQAFPSYRVSTWLWDIIRSISVNEYNQGDFTDGYVVNPIVDPVTHLQASYPKFKTKYGTYVSFKNGVWNSAKNSYDSERLKVINVPVLKSHEMFGVTGCIKNYMGVLTNSLTNGHDTIGYGSMGTEMAETRFPTLNILDAIWVNANPIEAGIDACGPDTTYATASYTNIIGASQDPVALDYWAAKHILVPTAQAKGYTSYSSLDPDYAPVISPLYESFHNYLERSMNELKKASFQTTMDESQMNVYLTQKLVRWGFPDLNGDGTVNIVDITIVAKAFNCKRGNAGWNPTADLDGNGIVNIVDMSIVAREYGRTMTIILKDGFESGTISIPPWTGQSATITVQSSVLHHGIYAMSVPRTSPRYIYKTINNPTVYTRFALRTTVLPTLASGNFIGFQSIADVSRLLHAVIYNDHGVIKWAIIDTGGTHCADWGPAVDTWYTVEVKASKSGTTTNSELFVDGVSVVTASDVDDATNFTTDYVGTWGVGAETGTVYWDCVQIADTYVGPELGTPLQASNTLTGPNNKDVIENNVANNARDISPDQSHNRIYHNSSVNNKEFQADLPTNTATTLGITAKLQTATTKVTSIRRPGQEQDRKLTSYSKRE